jgi:predicted metal-dependent hydrolase
MAVRKAVIPDIGVVTFYKRRRTKSIRLSITHDGQIRVTMPSWAPYRAGIDFVESKADWIRERTARSVTPLRTGDRIGKAHTVYFFNRKDAGKITTRVTGTDIRINLPQDVTSEDMEVQAIARQACIRALRAEAEQLLPKRLEALAIQHGFDYAGVRIKRLRSRWGSCSQAGEIVLNCFLMQLPWHLIDYVILHELLHTRRMAHGPVFWNELAAHVTDVKSLRKEIKSYQPALSPQSPLLTGQPKPVAISVA